MDPLLAWREEFPTLSKTVHLISHSLGAMPRRTRARLTQFADEWTDRNIRAWEEGWWDMPVTVGNLIGPIIGAGEGEVVMHQNVSVCQTIVHSCFDWTGRRNKLVTDTLNFPSNHYLFGHLPRVVNVPTEQLLEAIDEETRLVSVSHVTFRNSYVLDLAAIVERAHRVGAMVMADLYQSAGTVPVNVRALGVDFACGGSVKWLCGGPGAGYLYVRRDLWPELRPAATGWQAHRAPFAFADGPIEYADDILRFANGTPNVPAMYAAMSGYEIVNEIGVERIREKSQRQTRLLIELAREAGFAYRGPERDVERGGVVVIDVPDGKEIVAELARRDILVDYRPGAGIRMAPHFYSTDDECRMVIEEIKKLADRRATCA